MQTQSTPRPNRTVNPTAALAGAEDDFREEVNAFYEVSSGSVADDLNELEALARITAAYAASVETLMSRMHYARGQGNKHAFMEYLLDTVSDELDHGAGAVVRAQINKMESEK